MRYRLRPRYLQQEKKIRLEVGSNILIVVVKGSEWCVCVLVPSARVNPSCCELYCHVSSTGLYVFVNVYKR